MADIARLDVRTVEPDPRGARLLHDARLLGVHGLEAIVPVDVYFLAGRFDDAERALLETLLVDPLLQTGRWTAPSDTPCPDANAVETALLPGVTDTTAAVLLTAATRAGVMLDGAATGRRYELHGCLSDDEVDLLGRRLLSNAVIERWARGTIDAPLGTGAATTEPTADATSGIPMRWSTDEELAALDRARGLALDLAELRVIAAHFRDLGRDPSEVELETLAQTWSEHCAHKSFRAEVLLPDGTVAPPLLHRLRAATESLAAPFVRSAFVGNAGIVSFTPGTTVAVKAETHNHPSAIEPFGGANTGVGGVIRDVMGASHQPVAITDVLCFGPADLPAADVPAGVIHPRLVREGVVAGVADYGNKIGLPTVAGALWYDPAFTANPLVFAGCVGLAADTGRLVGSPQPGDLVVVLGGRTGRDGLRGATFSSATMDATTGDVAGASVQIGDPITEKLVIDLLARMGAASSAITDCGAGGLSSAVGEMADGVGAEVDLVAVPLKYAGLAPWEIWLSEAQERMVVAVAPALLERWRAAADDTGVELSVIGRFTGDGRLVVRHGDTVVLDLDTSFVHGGRPSRRLAAEPPTPRRCADVPRPSVPLHQVLVDLLAHPNIASKEAVVRRYDHEIGGATLVRPLVGVAADAPADGVVLAPPHLGHGVAIGIGLNPWFGLADPGRMAEAVVDEAIRNVVAVGADPDQVALMDNFSWGDPRRPSTFGELVAAVDGCVAASLRHRAPFVSGKDSLNNEYLGSDGHRHSVPPTLVVHAVAHVPDADAVVTSDLQHVDDVLVLVGRTRPEFGGSHLAHLTPGFDPCAAMVPAPDETAPARYRTLHRQILERRVRACHDLAEGGLAVALAEMSIGGRLGVRIDHLGHPDPVVGLFAESTGRFVCEVSPGDVAEFIAAFEAIGDEVAPIGRVTAEQRLDLPGCNVPLDDAVRAFTGRPIP